MSEFFDLLFKDTALTILFFVMVAVFVCAILAGIIRGLAHANAPTETKEVTIVAKRTKVDSTWMGNDMGSVAYTYYYITIEFEDGQRKELKIKHKKFGLVAEGDKGKMTYKGKKFVDFERTENTRLVQNKKEYCSHCGKLYPDGAVKCAGCGAARTK